MMISWSYVKHLCNVFFSFIATLVRANCCHFLANGVSKNKQPEKPIILFEYEQCPFCKRVREVACVLGLDLMIYPCPKNGKRFRDELQKRTGIEKLQFPYMIDPNTGVEMCESSDIVQYMWNMYGDSAKPNFLFRWMTWLPIQMPTLGFSSAIQVFSASVTGRGIYAMPSRSPRKPLTLWGNEHSPYVRLVREALCTLEIPYTLINAPMGTTWKRDAYREKFGNLLSDFRKTVNFIQIPLLEDPNTEKTLLESYDIVEYLYSHYKASRL